MITTKVDSYLEVFGYLNEGPDHVADYSLQPLSRAGGLEGALDLHFGALYTSSSPPQPAANWKVKIGPPVADWKLVVCGAARHWFFEQRFSPQVSNQWVKANVVEHFAAILSEELGEVTCREVFVTPPMFYELQWQDFAITSDKGRWLLHFGWSD
jgi:hypothetical protein